VLEPDFLTGYPGDTDPIDVVDVGSAPAPLGIVCQVKVIGALGMIDGTDRMTDWKIYVINVKDPRANEINDISDVSQDIRDEWALFWRFYKTPLGLKENFFYAPGSPRSFAADAVWLNAGMARKVIRNSAEEYRKLLKEYLPKLQRPYWVPGSTP
jgi:inorganic pyrophosphatase